MTVPQRKLPLRKQLSVEVNSQLPCPLPHVPAGRIFLVGMIFGQVLEALCATLNELVQGLFRVHQLLQLLPQLLLLRRSGGVFKYSPASGNRAAPIVGVSPYSRTLPSGLPCTTA